MIWIAWKRVITYLEFLCTELSCFEADRTYRRGAHNKLPYLQPRTLNFALQVNGHPTIRPRGWTDSHSRNSLSPTFRVVDQVVTGNSP